MCGIAGICRLDGQPLNEDARAHVRAMTDVITYRGPDGSGIWQEGPVSLGHRRLSIIDLSGGSQPMQDVDGELCIVFNGEIYNFAELRQELLQAGRVEVTTQLLPLEELPEFPQAERTLQTATVSSLRLDAVLAAMLHCSRSMAAELITAGRVEINHLPVESVHAPVYEGDVFTVRGKGRFGLTALPGKSKKDRLIIEFFQY